MRSTPAPCPICGQATTFSFSVPCDYRKPEIKRSYAVYWCRACEFGQVWDRPSKADVPGFYDVADYGTHGNAHRDDGCPASFLDRLRFHLSWRLDAGAELLPSDTRELLRQSRAPSVCEIGCGDGRRLLRFRAEGFSVTGVEPDPKARARAKEALGAVYEGTAEDLPHCIASTQYDVVLMCHVLEHCLDINRAIASAKTLLKPDGIFIVETPNNRALGFQVDRGEWPWADIPRHLNFFTPSSLERALAKHGLEVRSRSYVGFSRQYSNAWLSAEERIWSAFATHDPAPGRRPNFKARAWTRLVRSIWSPRAAKYDSVRLVAAA